MMNEAFMTRTLLAMARGRGSGPILRMLESQGLSRREATDVIALANDAMAQTLLTGERFQTGQLGADGSIDWLRPRRFLCSDPVCPCDGEVNLEPGIDGFLWVSPEVVERRRGCVTLIDLERTLRQQAGGGSSSASVVEVGTVGPIYLCRQAAIRRGLDLVTAAKDASKWANTGCVPLKATPRAEVGG